MICLTGDLHHQSLGTGNQRHCHLTELAVAQRFLELVEKYDVKVTFFISGKAFAEQWPELRPICEHPKVEIGGHNYSCFTPVFLHRFWKKATGSYNGPPWVQRRDALRTIEVIRRRTGRTISSWRNHMYMHGPFTERVLRQCGIRICSDGVAAKCNGPIPHSTGLVNFPINIIPDHEHLYHAERTPEWVAAWVKRYRWSDDFGPNSYHINEWTEMVLDGLRRHEKEETISNMIIHPITMYLCDQFRSAERILQYLGSRRTIHVSELL